METFMTRKLTRPSVFPQITLAALMLIAADVARAQGDYPNRTIKFIVPLPPGGSPDIVTRILGEKLAVRWGQPIVVENRPGAALNLGAEAVAKAPPDGYTLLSTPPGPLVTNQYLYPKLGFDPGTFVPISVVVKLPFILLAHSKVPASNLRELIAYAKGNPDKLTLASAGFGTPPHLVGELLQVRAGIRLRHVPYKGLEPALQDLLGGQVDLMFHAITDTLPHVKAGNVRALGVGSEARLAELPDVPSISEVLAGFVATTWFAVAAPPKTPPEITTKLSRAIVETINLPDVAMRLHDLGLTPVGTSPVETTAFLREERERWRDVIVAAGLKPQ